VGLAALADAPCVEAVEVARRFLDDDALAPEAATTIVRIAEGMDADDRGAIIETLAASAEITPNEHYQDLARRMIDEHEQYAGYITEWLLAGPYRIAGRDGLTLLDDAFAPETDPDSVEWRPVGARAVADRPWAVNLNHTFARGDDTVAYLRTWVYSPETSEVRLECGSDDGIKIWLNGRVVHENNQPRGLTAGEDRVEVRLGQGWNPLMLKINNGRGDFAAAARFRSTDNRMIEALRFRAAEQRPTDQPQSPQR
jgi:hypothetical protein